MKVSVTLVLTRRLSAYGPIEWQLKGFQPYSNDVYDESRTLVIVPYGMQIEA